MTTTSPTASRAASRPGSLHAPLPAPAEIEGFLVAEARLLDERRWEDWLALFAADGWYWVPIEEGQPDPRTTVSLIYDDRRLLETRVRRLAAGKLHAQSPVSRTSRIVANPTVEGEQDGIVTVRSKFQMVEYRRDRQRLFAGTQWHGLEAGTGTGGYVIRWKKVELVDCDSMMDGLNIPF
ncbi:MAG: aromatic-ring-hydroxylating dioxygenase subunit beta [Rhodospirillaceae bacterium]